MKTYSRRQTPSKHPVTCQHAVKARANSLTSSQWNVDRGHHLGWSCGAMSCPSVNPLNSLPVTSTVLEPRAFFS
eukprot:756121-Hanusia_phi.AAC.3